MPGFTGGDRMDLLVESETGPVRRRGRQLQPQRQPVAAGCRVPVWHPSILSLGGHKRGGRLNQIGAAGLWRGP